MWPFSEKNKMWINTFLRVKWTLEFEPGLLIFLYYNGWLDIARNWHHAPRNVTLASSVARVENIMSGRYINNRRPRQSRTVAHTRRAKNKVSTYRTRNVLYTAEWLKGNNEILEWIKCCVVLSFYQHPSLHQFIRLFSHR